jgi:hypothetical protein
MEKQNSMLGHNLAESTTGLSTLDELMNMSLRLEYNASVTNSMADQSVN